MKRNHCITEDGSSSFIIPEWDEAYHSTHGAVQESQHIFINSALADFKEQKTTVIILEYGFGTGLNALLSYYFAKENNIRIKYFSIEKYPLESAEFSELNYEKLLNKNEDVLQKMHKCIWNEEFKISDFFILKKIKADFRDGILLNQKCNLVCFDAFNPDLQGNLWSKEVFENVYQNMDENSVFITYSVKGFVKRTLKSIGFKIKKIPGPKGKREILKAYK